MTHGRPKRRRRIHDSNPIATAIWGAQVPDADELALMMAPADDLRRQIQAKESQGSRAADIAVLAGLVDHLNLSEELSKIGICSDAGSRDIIARCHRVIEHVEASSGPILPLQTADAEAALSLLWLISVQYRYASRRELAKAFVAVQTRCRQVVLGRMPGAEVVDLGAEASR